MPHATIANERQWERQLRQSEVRVSLRLHSIDPTPRNNLEGQGISFAAVEIPTRDEPTKEQGSLPFGPTDELAARFDTSEWISSSWGANSEESEGSTFEIKEGAVQRLGLWSRIIDSLTTVARALVMVVLHH